MSGAVSSKEAMKDPEGNFKLVYHALLNLLVSSYCSLTVLIFYLLELVEITILSYVVWNVVCLFLLYFYFFKVWKSSLSLWRHMERKRTRPMSSCDTVID